MEKTLLIGNQTIENSRLKNQIELMERKISELWLSDFISSNLKWDITDERKSLTDFKEAVKKEKEEK